MTASSHDPPSYAARRPARLEPGSSTAVGRIVGYRLGKLAGAGVLHGAWLDCGCADGGYTTALVALGAAEAVGVDPDPSSVRRAQERAAAPGVAYRVAPAEALPFPDRTFDGVLLNEVLEHVADEDATLREIRRVLRPGGHLALFSPNRWFPFEGHGLRLDERRSLPMPVPLIPWLPGRLTGRLLTARNYWPGELRRLVVRHGFDVVALGSAFPQFEIYRWLPRRAVERYRRLVPALEHAPVVRRFGVSTFILARRR